MGFSSDDLTDVTDDNERIVTNFPYDLIEPISLTIAENFLFLANNPNGLCIIKKFRS